MEIKYDKVLGEVREADVTDLSGYLKLDQSTPQTITGLADGYLNLSGGVITSTTLNISDWNTAYGWGNHADAGYAKLDCTNQPFTGNISFSSTADRTISVASSSSTGKYLAISSGNGATGGYSGGVISLIGGIGGNNLAGGNQGGNGGNSYLIGGKGGTGDTAGIGGNAYITGGASGDSSDGGARAGAVVITGGAVSNSSDGNGDGGSVNITGGSATGQISGSVNINAGSGGTSGVINIGTTRGIIYLGQDIYLNGDSRKLYFGAGNDASITYDGTNLIINSRAVGTGATIFSAGKVVVGKDIFPVATNLAVGVDGANAIGGWSSAGTAVSPILFMARARGTHASPTAVQSADFLGEVGFYGQFNSTIGSVGAGATIRAIAMGTFSATSYPTDLLFFTTASGSTALTENMRLTSTGRLGIGTTNPTAKLHIVSSSVASQLQLATNLTDNNTKYGGVTVSHYSNTEEPLIGFYGSSLATDNIVAFGGGSSSSNSATRISFYTAPNTTTLQGTERIRITSNGLVGIGNEAPNSLLDVSGGADGVTSVLATFRSKFGLNTGTTIRLANSSVVTSIAGVELTSLRTDDSANTDFIISSYTNTGTPAVTEKLRIKGISGNVGIGTASPSAKLDVNGNINATAYKVGTVAGASGTFTTADSKTVTVTNGIITSIV